MSEAKMLYYDGEGNRVDQNDPSAAKQFLSDDPNRPDSGKKAKAGVTFEAPAEESDESAAAADEEAKAQTAPADNKARKSSANK